MPIARDCKVYLPIKMLQMGGILRNSTTVDLYGRLSWTWTTWFGKCTRFPTMGSLVLCWPRGIVPFCETSQGFEETYLRNSLWCNMINSLVVSSKPPITFRHPAASILGVFESPKRDRHSKRIICEMKKIWICLHNQYKELPFCSWTIFNKPGL